jgi:hypothetical protein
MAPILGIYASSNYQRIVPDTGAMFPIAMANVGSAGAAYVEFTSIPQTYKHLQIRTIAQESTTLGTSYGTGILQFNGTSTTSNYKNHQVTGNGSSASAYSSTLSRGIVATFDTGSDNNIYNFGTSVVDILDYTSSNKLKTVRVLAGYDANSAGLIQLSSGLYYTNTNAITSIRILTESNAFTQNTQIALYGILG